MPNAYVAIRDGGKTSEEGATRLLNKVAGSLNSGRVGSADFVAAEDGTPSMDVIVSIGDIVIAYQSYFFHAWLTSEQSTTFASADPSNPRISALVAYVDLAIVDDTDSNNPDALVIMEVAGTAGAVPVAPDSTAIQAAVGAGNPWVRIANVRVEAAATSIVNAKITDTCPTFRLGGSGSLPAFQAYGTLTVINGLTNNWIVPPGVPSINRIDAVCLTAPTGAGLIMRLYNVTQAHEIGTVTMAAGVRTGSNTAMTNPTVATGDEIRFDCTQIGSTIPGADVTVQPSV